MSITAVSSSSIYQELQTYFQQRRTDVRQLGRDLASGTLADAQQDFKALQTLGQSGPNQNGDVFRNSQREQDLNAIGQALQSGDLAGAQQAFAQLEATYQKHQTMPPVFGPPQTSAAPPLKHQTMPPVFGPPSISALPPSSGLDTTA